MQVGTPARQPGLRVRPDNVPSRYKAKQTRLGRTLPAAYTGTHHGHTRGRLLSSYGHSSDKSTVSAGPRHPMRTGLEDQARPKRQNELTCLARADVSGELIEANEVAGASDTSGAARALGAPSGCWGLWDDGSDGASDDGPEDWGAASDLISIRQPVSLAASLAFCPSLPIARESW